MATFLPFKSPKILTLIWEWLILQKSTPSQDHITNFVFRHDIVADMYNFLASHSPNSTETAAVFMLLFKDNDKSKSNQMHLRSSLPQNQLCVHTAFSTECDQSRSLPIITQSDALYQHIVYAKDCNCIHVETTKSLQAQDLLAAAQRAYKFSKIKGRPQN